MILFTNAYSCVATVVNYFLLLEYIYSYINNNNRYHKQVVYLSVVQDRCDGENIYNVHNFRTGTRVGQYYDIIVYRDIKVS